MSDISDSIKYLYREFILRDLLSFITPGVIVVSSILLLRWDLPQILRYATSIPFLLYIPIFGILFIVGFSIQCLGAELLHIIQFHSCDNDRESYRRLVALHKKADEKANRQHERFVVLKQMCGNGALSIFIATIFLAIRLYKLHCPIFAFLLVSLIMGISLLRGHFIHLERQQDWEDLFIFK